MTTDRSKRTICIAPMLDWTDRHCRYFHRQLTQQSWLYTEMVTTGALLHGDVARHLQFNPAEQPVALQLGGADPHDLAYAAKLGETWGYAEINLNCGCPSSRVQRGAFGACLMAEPNVVATGVKAMRDAVSIPVTVKHRIGLDQQQDYGFVRDFVGQVAEAGCCTFIVHARNAVLQGLSPKDNREIPPLRYDVVYQLKRDFPQLEIILNGGIKTYDDIALHLQHVDGVMIGRQAYHEPAWLHGLDAQFYGAVMESHSHSSEDDAIRDVVHAMDAYIRHQASLGVVPRQIVRHMLGLFNGKVGARYYRFTLSDHHALAREGVNCLRAAVEPFSLFT
jgi:tRNA-dihydrouridine synthase A